MLNRFKQFLRDNRGVALIEFLAVAPVMFIILFGGIEVARYILILQKLEKATYTLTSIVSQLPPATAQAQGGEISEARLRTVFAQFDLLMAPYSNGRPEQYQVVFSSVIFHPSSGMFIRWQQFDGTLPNNSIVTGAQPSNNVQQCSRPQFPPRIAALMVNMIAEENIIIGEVAFEYQPILGRALGATQAMNVMGFSLAPRTVTRQIFLHSRNGQLVDLPPRYGFGQGACGF